MGDQRRQQAEPADGPGRQGTRLPIEGAEHADGPAVAVGQRHADERAGAERHAVGRTVGHQDDRAGLSTAAPQGVGERDRVARPQAESAIVGVGHARCGTIGGGHDHGAQTQDVAGEGERRGDGTVRRSASTNGADDERVIGDRRMIHGSGASTAPPGLGPRLRSQADPDVRIGDSAQARDGGSCPAHDRKRPIVSRMIVAAVPANVRFHRVFIRRPRSIGRSAGRNLRTPVQQRVGRRGHALRPRSRGRGGRGSSPGDHPGTVAEASHRSDRSSWTRPK